jgi:hypothetical protein
MSRFHTTEFDLLPQLAFRKGEKGRLMTLEGGKGGSAPPPDPYLQSLQGQSLASQIKVNDEMLAQSRSLAPTIKEQMEFGLQSARTAYDQSQADRTYALGKRDQYDSVVNPLVDEAKNYDEGAERARMMGIASADIGKSFGSAQDQQSRSMERMGIAPTSGRFQSAGQNAELAEASARAAAGQKVSEAAKANGLNLKLNAANMLSGFPAMATGLTGTGANFGTAGTGVANAGLSGMNSGLATAGSGYGDTAKTAGSIYGNQADTWSRANTAASAQSAETWGAVAGAALMFLSDPRLKEDIVLVGRRPDGLNEYTWRYRGSANVYRGVMADEVQKVKPWAVKNVGGYLAVDYSKLG